MATDSRAREVGATYRLQLGAGTDFATASRRVGYLASLGVTHLYLSPVLQARPGSTHGYDVADPGRVSEPLGGRPGLEALAAAAAARGLGLVADIVPNHVGTGEHNPLWEALLAEGRTGEAGDVFDVDWAPPLPGGTDKVVVPVLGTGYGQVLHAGELAVEEVGETLRLRYHDQSFPLSEASVEALRRSGGPEALRGTPGQPGTWTRLHALLEQQHYRLVHWRAGDALVNYRRFFAISDLAAVRVEDEAVYARTHAEVLDLVAAGTLDGLRVDHVDGLTDPGGYLERLRADAGGAWIVAEKILGPSEGVPAWPVDGTTGYEFLDGVLRLYVDHGAEPGLTALAEAFDAWPPDPDEAVRQAKLGVLSTDLSADADRLAARFWELCQEHREVRDVALKDCDEVLRHTVAALAVYRLYTLPGETPSAADGRWLEEALASARQASARDRGAGGGSRGAAPGFLWDFLDGVLAGRAGEGPLHHEVVRRFHQLSAAAAAKGVEDTFLYRQHRLAALNEVGGQPGRFGVESGGRGGGAVEAFHDASAERARGHPAGMLTTATHDTKRGEDVRLRIAALSEMVDEWREVTTAWASRHQPVVAVTPRGPAPDPATEYLLYQTLVGMWPLYQARERLADIGERLTAYLVKAAREAGMRTTWTEPDEVFERGLASFVGWLLDPDASGPFLDELEVLCDGVAEIAMVSGLGQVLLRSTSPGVPDTYQGNELWDDSLVDPDNRRPVDFDLRARLLAELDRDPPPPRELLAVRRDGRVKLWVLSRALRARRDHAGCLGASGGYRPLEVEGALASHVVAFARVADAEFEGGTRPGGAAVVVVPRLVGRLIGGRGRPPLGEDWQDTALLLDGDLAGYEWRDALGGPGAGRGARLRLEEVLADLPVALLVARG